MTEETFSDEMLMRFADGELDPATAARIEKAMETDDGLVARVAMFIETRAQSQAALKPLLDEPVPEKLVAAVERMIEEKRAGEKQGTASVLPFDAKRKAARPWSPQWTLPIAASLAAIVGGLAGYWAANTNERAQGGLWVAGVIRPALAEALATVESGKEIRLAGISDRFRAIATFRDDAQNLCREFEVEFGEPFHGDVGRLPYRRRVARQLRGGGAGRRRRLRPGLVDRSSRRLSFGDRSRRSDVGRGGSSSAGRGPSQRELSLAGVLLTKGIKPVTARYSAGPLSRSDLKRSNSHDKTLEVEVRSGGGRCRVGNHRSRGEGECHGGSRCRAAEGQSGEQRGRDHRRRQQLFQLLVERLVEFELKLVEQLQFELVEQFKLQQLVELELEFFEQFELELFVEQLFELQFEPQQLAQLALATQTKTGAGSSGPRSFCVSAKVQRKARATLRYQPSLAIVLR